MKRLLLFVMLIAGCSEQRPPAPTAEEGQQLDDAEAMLDELANEEGPGTEVPDPSSNSD